MRRCVSSLLLSHLKKKKKKKKSFWKGDETVQMLAYALQFTQVVGHNCETQIALKSYSWRSLLVSFEHTHALLPLQGIH